MTTPALLSIIGKCCVNPQGSKRQCSAQVTIIMLGWVSSANPRWTRTWECLRISISQTLKCISRHRGVVYFRMSPGFTVVGTTGRSAVMTLPASPGAYSVSRNRARYRIWGKVVENVLFCRLIPKHSTEEWSHGENKSLQAIHPAAQASIPCASESFKPPKSLKLLCSGAFGRDRR